MAKGRAGNINAGAGRLYPARPESSGIFDNEVAAALVERLVDDALAEMFQVEIDDVRTVAENVCL